MEVDLKRPPYVSTACCFDAGETLHSRFKITVVNIIKYVLTFQRQYADVKFKKSGNICHHTAGVQVLYICICVYHQYNCNKSTHRGAECEGRFLPQIKFLLLIFWRNSTPQWARASSFKRLLDHTQRRTTVGRTLLDE